MDLLKNKICNSRNVNTIMDKRDYVQYSDAIRAVTDYYNSRMPSKEEIKKAMDEILINQTYPLSDRLAREINQWWTKRLGI